MRRALAAALAFVAVSAGTIPAGASATPTATTVSSNWAGYTVSGSTLSSVSATWTQPEADCKTAAGQTAAAFWVGLGGNSETSNALEQIGTESDCSLNGAARYSAWYELVPAASVKTPLEVSAGDKIRASVRVTGSSVTIRLRDLTTGKSFAKTLRMAAPDISSAEWIAEAPSAVIPGGTRILPLTDFGTVRFANASATTASGHTGTISDSSWSAARIDLLSEGGPGGPGFHPFAEAAGGSQAATSRLAAGGSAFAVTWSQTGQV